MQDTRNVIDVYKGQPIESIVRDLDARGVSLEIAVENLTRDFNMGTIIRSANAFGVRHIHIIGRRQWNKRGAMMTDKYLHIHYYASVDEFMDTVTNKTIIAVDNIERSIPLHDMTFPDDIVLVFGSERDGLSEALLAKVEQVVAIEQFGSSRSLNVGVAAGVVMYEWLRQRHLP